MQIKHVLLNEVHLEYLWIDPDLKTAEAELQPRDHNTHRIRPPATAVFKLLHWSCSLPSIVPVHLPPFPVLSEYSYQAKFGDARDTLCEVSSMVTCYSLRL